MRVLAAYLGVEVSQKTILLLLQLMSFYNCKEAETINCLEELYFSHKELLPKKTWTDGNLAELLFEMLEDKDTVAYSAYIYGLAKVVFLTMFFCVIFHILSFCFRTKLNFQSKILICLIVVFFEFEC